MAGSRRIAAFAGTALLAACAAEEPGIIVPPPPPTEVQNIVDTLHGVAVRDPYRWLEDQQAPATRAWIDAQNAHTDTVLDVLPDRERLREVAAGVLERDVIGLPNERGGRYFYSKRRADQDLAVVYVRDGLHGADRVLIDPHPTEPGPHDERGAARHFRRRPDRRVRRARRRRRRGLHPAPRRGHGRGSSRRPPAGALRAGGAGAGRPRLLLRTVRRRDPAGDVSRAGRRPVDRPAAVRRGLRAPPYSGHPALRRRPLARRPRHRGVIRADGDPREGSRGQPDHS